MHFLPLDDASFVVKQRKAVPHPFVLDAIAVLSPRTRPMFGCLAVYVWGEDCSHTPRQARRNGRQRSVAGNDRRAPRQSAPGVPKHAVNSGLGKRCNGLAGPSGRCPGFRGGVAARMRAHPRQGSSNRQGTGGAARLGLDGSEDGKIPKPATGPQEPCETSRQVVTNSSGPRIRGTGGDPPSRAILAETGIPWIANPAHLCSRRNLDFPGHRSVEEPAPRTSPASGRARGDAAGQVRNVGGRQPSFSTRRTRSRTL